MYLGKVVEVAPAEELYAAAAPSVHRGAALGGADPRPAARVAARRIVLAGDVPSPVAPPAGCRFHPRCRYATEICSQKEPPLRPFGESGHIAACHHPLNVGPRPEAHVHRAAKE